ncbi:MAG: hypothetical protein WC728_03420 [Elusimicrobiota bacterium]
MLRGLLVLASCLAAFAGEVKRPLPVQKAPGEARPCVSRGAKGLREPNDLDSLLDCQFKFRQSWVRRYSEKEGRQPSDAAMDRFDDFQRAEARDYLVRHPARAQTRDGADAGRGASAPRAKASSSRGKWDCSFRHPGAQKWAKPSAEDEGLSETWDRTTRAMDKNLEGRDPAMANDLRALGNVMMSESEGGRKGITPAAAQAVLDFLQCQRGGPSVEMRGLLRSVSQDGADLKPATLLQLKRAARAAKGEELQLGVESGLEKWLLDPGTDPSVSLDDLLLD